MTSPLVCIVILNWNGWKDTVECLESIIRSSYSNYCCIVVDNGSNDDSCKQIKAWAQGDILVESPYLNSRCYVNSMEVIHYDRSTAEIGGIQEIEKKLFFMPAANKLVLIQSEENLGFAGGSNIGIRYALSVGAEYILLLNNDTVIDNSALQNMAYFMEHYPVYQGITGQIRLYQNPSVIWNCGGVLTFYGSRRYYYKNCQVQKVPNSGYNNISFITGCAAMFRSSIFRKAGLLSDRFFFGEEDFELSLRLKHMKCKLACIYNAIIYHKVGNSINVVTNGNNIGSAYIYYLNRFINLRYYWHNIPWKVWRFFCFIYIFPLLYFKYGISWVDLCKLRKKLIEDSTTMDQVSKTTFELALKSNFL